MPPKRKADDDEEQPNAQQKKKKRTEVARNIAVQSLPPGPSKQAIKSSIVGLPSSLNVEKFAEARAFELKAMQDAIKSARSGSTHRIWQTLPRHLRRRAASHDVRRVPTRLRQKAKAEMDPVRKKFSKSQMPKRGKAKQISRTESFLRRQRNKTWLETHIWHAKRMKMENMWGYRLAVHPNEKAFRPSHRASLHGSILHDASYDAILELKGPEELLKTVLSNCCDPQGAGPGAVRFASGSRVCDTHIYKSGSYPFDLVGPVTVIWQPPAIPPTITNPKNKSDGKQRKSTRKGKEKAKPVDAPKLAHRRVWVKCHPLCYQDIYTTIQHTASVTLDAIRQDPETRDIEMEFELADLKGQLNVFEIMGPKSSQVIKGALTPENEDQRNEFKQFWSSLGDLQCPGSVPRGMVIGCKVYDPRLNYPPKNAKPRIDKSILPSVNLPTGIWPTPKLASCAIWDENIRDGLSKPRYKKRDMDERRSKNLVPGTKLNPLRQDDRVPVLLIQRSIESSVSFNDAHPTCEARALHGWTLIFPKGWAMPFLSSLIFTGTRVGGQRERQTQHFEAACTHFPHDFPSTPGYVQFAREREREERARWERKPPAKRPNWDKLGTRSPWIPDWEVVAGIRPPTVIDDGLVSTQRDEQEPTDSHDSKLWLLRGTESKSMMESISKSPSPSTALLARINELRLKRQAPVVAVSADDLLKGSLATVLVSLPFRGAPEHNAIIYSISDDEVQMWRAALRNTGNGDSVYETDVVPSADAIIGYITNGAYSLSIGKGQAIGVVPVSLYLDLKLQCQRLGIMGAPLVKIRNRDGVICRVAYLEVMC